jgi:tRNA(fMet)-specific endonuclease VapC
MKMAGNKAFLDTNAVVGFLNGESIVVERLRAEGGVAICLTVVGELYFGMMKSNRRAENIYRLEGFLSSCELLSGDSDTAKEYGLIKLRLKERGRPIPDNVSL